MAYADAFLPSKWLVLGYVPYHPDDEYVRVLDSKTQDLKHLNTTEESGGDKSSAFSENLLVPKQILMTTAKADSAVCIEFVIADSFNSCHIKHPNISLNLVVSHKNFPLMERRLIFNHTDMCQPMNIGKEGYFCIKYNRNQIPENSKIAFRKMFISRLFLDCRERAQKLTSQDFNLLRLPVSEKILHRKHISSCPSISCSKWLENEDACRPREINSSRFFPQRKVNKGTETLLIIGVVFAVWSIVMVVVQCATSLRRTMPSGNKQHLSVKSSSSLATLPSALHSTGADGHLDLE
jgi:hypothetical protein